MGFQAGKSGNPAGRPKGIRDKRTELRGLLEPHAPELVAKAVEMAKGGDSAALRLCLERLIPPMKAKDEPVRLQVDGDSLADVGRAALNAVVAGEIGPDDAGAVLGAVAAQARVVELTDIERRLAALESNRG